MNFFKGCRNPREIRRRYLEMALRHHPSRNPGAMENAVKIMANLNIAFHQYLHEPEDLLLVAKIDDLLHLNLDSITIKISGYWIFVEGDVEPDNGLLLSSGFSWHDDLKRFYWGPSLN